MPIVPPQPPQAPQRPRVRGIDQPTAASLRSGHLRIVVWLHPAVQVPEGDEIDCAPAAFDALFGDGMAQRLLITPETAWMGRVVRAASAGPASDSLASVPELVRSTPYSHIYLLALTGGSGAGDVSETLSQSAAVTMAYPEPLFVECGVPLKYKSSDIFKNHQDYLKAGTGIDIEPVWAKGYTGEGISAGVVDSVANVSDLRGTVAVVSVPAPTGAAAATSSVDVHTHACYSVGILGAADSDTVAIGVAPGVTVRYAPVMTLNSTHLVNALEALKGLLKAGDVVNLSLGLGAGLDVKHPYAGTADLLKAFPKALTETVAGSAEKRASAVMTDMPVEFDPAVLKVVGDLTALGVTVVEAAGNGVDVMLAGERWLVRTGHGADVGGRWLGYTGAGLATSLKAYRSALAKTHAMTLDRASLATFADAGGIVVSCGYVVGTYQGQTLTPPALVSNDSLNHGNRLDCCATVLDASPLGLVKTVGQTVSGTSLCAPVIAGAVAVLQGMAVSLFKSPLKPAIVRALLSDPDLGTAPRGHAVGTLPNLHRQMTLLEGAGGQPLALLAAIKVQQTKSAARVKTAMAAAGGATPPFVHDPYTVFTAGTSRSPGRWDPLPLALVTDVFFALPGQSQNTGSAAKG